MGGKRVLVAMSGGVDSSVAAYLLQCQGFECVGCTMKLYDNEDAGIAAERACCSLDDVEDARRVARGLGIPHYVFNFSHDFKEKVIGPFVAAYEQGRTPNPCIECNRHLKFAKLMERAHDLECDYVATGHYAQVNRVQGRYLLQKGRDARKDQSYVLYDLDQEKLARVLLPLGALSKSQVRDIAQQQGFGNAEKPESQDICFVPQGDYAQVVALHSGSEPRPGDFVDVAGNVIGRHRGIVRYTIGQRKGLGVAAGRRLYVCRIDPAANVVVLGDRDDLRQNALVARAFVWTAGEPPAPAFRAAAKIRYRQAEQPATVFADVDSVRIVFDEPQEAIAPGQSVVVYDGNTVLGGGEIEAGMDVTGGSCFSC